MNNNYKDINFDKFAEDTDESLTNNEKIKVRENFYKSAGIDEGQRPNTTLSIRKFSRKFVAFAAAMVVVLAFGAVAYATDFFGLGIVKHYDVSYESPFPEDSNQFKAQKEYEKYISSMSESERDKDSEEWLAMHDDLWGKDGEKIENMWEEEMTLPIVYTKQSRTKIKEISKKYNLKMEEYEFHTTSMDKAFSQSGVPNFMGDAKSIIDSLATIKEDGYICGDKGTLSMGLGNGLWDIYVYPKDVFPGIPAWSSNLDDTESDKDAKMEQWAFTTKDNLKVKAEISTLRKINGYNFVYNGDNYTMTFQMMRFGSAEGDKDIPILNKEEFEEIINSFDLNLL